MTNMTFEEQLTKYLTDVHAIEVQALAQLKRAPRIAADPGLARDLADHEVETREHERLVREELERRGAAPSAVKDAAARLSGWGMVLFADFNPDTTGKLAMHAYSYEHMELAAYELLRRVAERGADSAARALAVRIGEEERAMADRVGEHWDGAVDASLREKGADDMPKQVVKYLRDAHALEAQSIQMLETGPKLAEFDELADAFGWHLEQTREHQRLVDGRLDQLGSGPGRFQAGALRAGALNMGAFFKGQPDTPIKLSGFAYALEGLEVGAYELLKRTALRADDEQTALLAEHILAEEQTAAEAFAATWDAAVSAGLAQQVG